MNVVLISTSDIGHGAGIAAYRLHCALRKMGVNSNMLVASKASQDPHVFWSREQPATLVGKIIRKIQHWIEFVLNIAGLQSQYSVASYNLKNHKLIQDADIIHFHNIHRHMFNFSLSLLGLINRKPIFWTLHDMWPITGHCFYSYNCERWKIGCGHCPDLMIFPPLLYDTTVWQWKWKKKIYDNSRPVVIAPSVWLYNLAKASPLLKKCRIENIPYCIDQEIFYPQDKFSLRKKYDFPIDAKVILFISPSKDKRKGFKYFEMALNKITVPGKVMILSIGKIKISSQLKEKFDFREMGYVRDTKILSEMYSIADVYVTPSLYDNLPNTVLESLACGTPVVAFNTGGIPDMIEHLKNGYLARWSDAHDLAKGIDLFLNDENLMKNAKENAVLKITRQFSENLVAQKHLELYQKYLTG